MLTRGGNALNYCGPSIACTMPTLNHRCGAETVYDDFGKPKAEQTLLLLHGIGANRRMWDRQVEPFVGAGYRLLIPDLLGHGESSQLPGVGFDAWHRQLFDLMDHCNSHKVAVIGVSMGGVIAQSLVLAAQSRFTHLILSDTFCELATISDKAAGAVQSLAFRLFRSFGQRLLAKAISGAYRAPFASEARKYFVQCTLESDLQQLLLARQTINRAKFRAALGAVEIPSLVMVGAGLGQAFVDTNRVIAQALPASRFEQIKQSMDPSNLVNPIAFNHLTLGFLSNTRVSAPGVASDSEDLA